MTVEKSAPQPQVRYRFGPYEVDASGGGLRKYGIRLRLERKPYQVLLTGPPRLELLEVKTGEWRDLAVGSPFPNQWAWSRDGRYVYLDFPLGKNASIQRMRLSDGRREKVADVANVARSQGNFDLWFGLDPRDSPLILRDLSSQQIYALELQP